jgi:hypothetical protein
LENLCAIVLPVLSAPVYEEPWLQAKAQFILHTLLGRAFNHLLSVLRMPVEHHFARLQRFRILADVFRGCPQRHEDIFCIVAGLLNYRQTGRLCLG